MPAGYAPADVPVCADTAVRDDAYETATAEGEPFFAVERYDEGYAVTYDLLPAGVQLAAPAHSELTERVTRTVEAIVGDEANATVEVSRSISPSLGNISFFEREETAREVAATLSRLVLDENNWVPADRPADVSPTDHRRN